MIARAATPRAIGSDAIAPRGEAAATGIPRGSQGPPIDVGDLPPLDPSATPTLPPTATVDPGAARQGSTQGPTKLAPVWSTVSASGGAASDTCRNYTATRTLLGQPRQVGGVACREPNGQWQIISELPR